MIDKELELFNQKRGKRGKCDGYKRVRKNS